MILDETGREPGDAHGAEVPREPSPVSGAGPDIDPNYDPAFQRGYRPRPGERSRTRLRDSTPATDTSPFRRSVVGDEPHVTPFALTDRDVRPDPDLDLDRKLDLAAEPEPEIADPLVAQLEALGVDTRPAFSGAEPAPIVVGSILDRVDVSPRRNPFFLVLWILGGGFVVLGIVLYAVSVYTSYTRSSTELDLTTLVFSQIGWMLAGPLVTVGLATIVSLVLLTALRSRPKALSAERD
jgi:hypothetical protein